jgi:hypothetical protein
MNAFSNLTGVDVKPITSWETLLEVAHPLAKEKGWWDDMDRPIDEQVANFHAEISEAWEEYRAGRMETWYSRHGSRVEELKVIDGIMHTNVADVWKGPEDAVWIVAKPEGFWVEIADLLVRLADTCGRYEWKPVDASPDLNIDPTVNPKIPAFVLYLHQKANELVTEFGDWERGVTSIAGEFVTEVSMYARIHGVDLWPIVNEKVAYNRTRSMRHGGKLA